MINPLLNSAYPVAFRMSVLLAIVATITSAASFLFWELFSRDVPMGVGNLRGTALTVLVIAVPLLVVSMGLAARGSTAAVFVWLGCLAYIAYNAVMFNFAAHFNSLFLLNTTLLALVFWALVALLRSIDAATVLSVARSVPARGISVYLILCAMAFGGLWLLAIIPATITNSMPETIARAGLTQNTVWVLDFAFTFPLMLLGAVWIWHRRSWGYVIAGMMVIMLTIETASIVVDQIYGHLHDKTATLSAVPPMLFFTALGLGFSMLFLLSLRKAGRL